MSKDTFVNWNDLAHFLQWEGSMEDLKQVLLDKTNAKTIGHTGWRLVASPSGKTVELIPGPILAGYGDNSSEARSHLAMRLHEIARLITEEDVMEVYKITKEAHG